MTCIQWFVGVLGRCILPAALVAAALAMPAGLRADEPSAAKTPQAAVYEKLARGELAAAAESVGELLKESPESAEGKALQLRIRGLQAKDKLSGAGGPSSEDAWKAYRAEMDVVLADLKAISAQGEDPQVFYLVGHAAADHALQTAERYAALDEKGDASGCEAVASQIGEAMSLSAESLKKCLDANPRHAAAKGAMGQLIVYVAPDGGCAVMLEALELDPKQSWVLHALLEHMTRSELILNPEFTRRLREAVRAMGPDAVPSLRVAAKKHLGRCAELSEALENIAATGFDSPELSDMFSRHSEAHAFCKAMADALEEKAE